MTNTLLTQTLNQPLHQALVAAPNAGSTLLSFLEGTMPAGVSFARASSATDFNSAGNLLSEPQDSPRFDFHPFTRQPRGLLIEGARTNLLLNSAALSTQTIPVTAVAHTLSFYGTGSVTLSGAATGTLNGTGTFPNRATLTFTPTAGTLTLTVSGTVEAAQCEIGAFASSYIPTTGVAATRATDSALLLDLATLGFNPQEGTIICEFETAQSAPASTFPTLWQFDDNTTGNRIGAYYSSINRLNMIMNTGGVNQGDIGTSNGFTPGNIAKSAVAWRADDRAGCLNGGPVMTDITASIPNVNRLRLGTQVSNGAPAFAWLRRVVYSPTRLPNSQLQELTN